MGYMDQTWLTQILFPLFVPLKLKLTDEDACKQVEHKTKLLI